MALNRAVEDDGLGTKGMCGISTELGNMVRRNVEPCRADLQRALKGQAAGTSTNVLVERSLARKRTSRRLLRTWERYVVVDRRRSIKEDLAFCFQQSHTRMIHQSMFLGVMRVNHPTLPRDPRTLMRPPRDCPKNYIGSGVYVHFGLEEALLHHLSFPGNSDYTSAHLQLYIDEVSPFNASKTQLFLILGRTVSPLTSKPLIMGIYCGPSKPSRVAEFPADCIIELRHLLRDGL
ncbi:uncharacterized protein DEA37_0006212 [Paragonimus westermani]|uniref:Uncharacterized protein n=1 Tax=Paragonimus westermani TaxID=34504 RepID=A0A5J4NVY1_9TREM|nr:uncharacterized protein DEA37_0006212 [Paragonimus westermani]